MTLLKRLQQYQTEGLNSRIAVAGKLTRVVGLTLEAIGCRAAVGSLCHIETQDGVLEAEVVGFSGEKLFLMPSEQLKGVIPGAKVTPLSEEHGIPVGMALLGRVIDGVGTPLDGLGDILTADTARYTTIRLNPLARRAITQPMDVGVRAINAMLTVGQGQRMGLFAGSGVGKSVLLGMMTRGTTADVVVVGLIGERGREVKEFIEEILGEEGRERAVVVAAPADASPLMRLKGCETALTIAEYFRDQGKDVLLMMDSLTRFSMAQREIGLASGEPPVTRGYPPSVYSEMPKLLERAGRADKGSITGLYTVLVDGDDFNEPITDTARSILDGHIMLDRKLGHKNHYPAIDVLQSISRVMSAIATKEHKNLAGRLKNVLATYTEAEDLINIGAYKNGSNQDIDYAIQKIGAVNSFLCQGTDEKFSFEEELELLEKVFE